MVKTQTAMKKTILILFSLNFLLFLSCTNDDSDDRYAEYIVARPLVMSKADFATSVTIVAPKPIEESGKVYALHEAQAQRDGIDSEFIQDNRKQMDEAELNFRELTQRIQKFKDNLSRTVVRAPVDGTVKTLHVVTVGGVIRPGDPVVDLVPAGDRLIVEAKLQVQDIGYVVPGQDALIKLASGEASRFSPLHGTVIQVSPDTLLTKDGHPYYKVRIATESDHFSHGKLTYNLFPGMQVAASIRTGTRTVARYLLDPLLSKLDNALGER